MNNYKSRYPLYLLKKRIFSTKYINKEALFVSSLYQAWKSERSQMRISWLVILASYYILKEMHLGQCAKTFPKRAQLNVSRLEVYSSGCSSRSSNNSSGTDTRLTSVVDEETASSRLFMPSTNTFDKRRT